MPEYNAGAVLREAETGLPLGVTGRPLVTSSEGGGGGGGDASAANQVTGNTSLAIIDDWDESDRAKVNPIVGQAGITGGAGTVAANTPRVTHASDDPAVAHLDAIETALEGTLTVGGSVAAGVGLTPLTVSYAAETGNKTLGTPSTGKTYLVHRIDVSFTSGTAGTVGARAGVAGTIIGKTRFPNVDGFKAPLLALSDDYWNVGVDTALVVNASSSITADVTAWVEEFTV